MLDWVQEHGLTFLIGAPTNLAMLTAEQTARAARPGSLKGIVTMGAPLDREACLRYQEVLTPRIFNGYGTTEAFWNTFLRPSDLPDARRARRAAPAPTTTSPWCASTRTAGPIPTTTSPRTASEVGEVVVRSVKSGYAYVNQPERAGGALPRRLAVHRRPGHLGRGRVRDDRRPQGRHDHLRR